MASLHFYECEQCSAVSPRIGATQRKAGDLVLSPYGVIDCSACGLSKGAVLIRHPNIFPELDRLLQKCKA